MRNVCFHILILILLTAGSVRAEKMVLWIQATNPLDKEQPVEIKSNLPPRIRGTNDIIELNGLELGYDVKNDIYYVSSNLILGPKENREFRIVLKDVWTIPEDEIKTLGSKSDELTKQLAKTEYKEISVEYLERIRKLLSGIKDLQDKNAIVAGVKPIQHIKAYEANIEELDRVKRDVGRLENMVLSSGLDPGGLIGTVKEAPPPDRNVELPEGQQYNKAIVRITVRNTSPNETRPIPIKHYLPEEVKISDVLNAGELDVSVDPKSGLTYVHKPDVQVPPLGEKVFSVEINDKWNINLPRIVLLRETADELLLTVQSKAKVQSVINMLESLKVELDGIEKEERPKELNNQYVLFFRDQAERLDVIEEQINRIQSALKPMQRTSKLGFKAKPPSMKSTWMIIYIILGFLAVVSLLFFLRWYAAPSADVSGSLSGGGQGKEGEGSGDSK